MLFAVVIKTAGSSNSLTDSSSLSGDAGGGSTADWVTDRDGLDKFSWRAYYFICNRRKTLLACVHVRVLGGTSIPPNVYAINTADTARKTPGCIFSDNSCVCGVISWHVDILIGDRCHVMKPLQKKLRWISSLKLVCRLTMNWVTPFANAYSAPNTFSSRWDTGFPARQTLWSFRVGHHLSLASSTISWNNLKGTRKSRRNIVVIILVVVVVAVEVACNITSIQKASHHCSRPVSGSCQYLSQKRLSSHVVHELLFTLINDDNAGEMRLTTKTSCAKFKIWRFELVKKFFVCRSVDTPDSEVDTQKTRFWCVEIEN